MLLSDSPMPVTGVSMSNGAVPRETVGDAPGCSQVFATDALLESPLVGSDSSVE